MKNNQLIILAVAAIAAYLVLNERAENQRLFNDLKAYTGGMPNLYNKPIIFEGGTVYA